VLFGVMAGTLCNFATQLKFFAGYDDSLDVSPGSDERSFLIFEKAVKGLFGVYLTYMQFRFF
jgi:hypothetical protein